MTLDPALIERDRRSSGSSVKDLVQNFEYLDRQVDQIERTQSVSECNVPRTGLPGNLKWQSRGPSRGADAAG